ncbi:hypothetical protein [Gulosibacter sp. ACHW.36C]|uniref:Uncharacterized protein n=1 Tax=Gulosibacter sediminis TaxID=1729695 RepID=A0ABY4MWE6_9MICO|nr:hypothetical protein [Gulosibacter sediminis]UQN14747.1 hypothetical protein M3M28_11995 [Gulosibacter sediminis]
MTSEQTALLERIRARLTAERGVREVPIFGGVSVLVGGKLLVATRGSDVAGEDDDLDDR